MTLYRLTTERVKIGGASNGFMAIPMVSKN